MTAHLELHEFPFQDKQHVLWVPDDVSGDPLNFRICFSLAYSFRTTSRLMVFSHILDCDVRLTPFFHQYHITAMALIESAASFRPRCDEILADGTLGNRLVLAGVDTFSKLAFSVGTPQTPPTEAQFDTFSTHIFGPQASNDFTLKPPLWLL